MRTDQEKFYRLNLWEEVVGTLVEADDNKRTAVFKTENKIRIKFPERSSIELEDKVGEKIGILRTDLEGEKEFLTCNLENENPHA